MTFAVKRTDLSQYETFQVSGPLGNRVTIAVRGQSHYPFNETRGRYSIHLMVWGDFGPWEHFWSHAGGPQETWWNWLHSTDRGYWLGKMVKNETEFDLQKSEAMAHKQIEELWQEVRGDVGVNRQDFHDAHNALRDVESQDQFYNVVSSLTYSCQAYSSVLRCYVDRQRPMFEDYSDMGHYRIKPNLVWFWDNIWRPFIEQAKRTKGFNQHDYVGSLK